MEVIFRGGRLLSEFHEAEGLNHRSTSASISPAQSVVQKWKPPSPGIIKINTDAAVGKAGIGLGFIARNEKGSFIFAGAMFSPNIFVPQIAEALSMRDAIIQARQWGYHRIILESDCFQNILALSSGVFPLNYSGVVIEEVYRLASMFQSCSFVHIKRTLNVPAHELSQLALYSKSGKVWLGECPEAIKPFVIADSL